MTETQSVIMKQVLLWQPESTEHDDNYSRLNFVHERFTEFVMIGNKVFITNSCPVSYKFWSCFWIEKNIILLISGFLTSIQLNFGQKCPWPFRYIGYFLSGNTCTGILPEICVVIMLPYLVLWKYTNIHSHYW